MLEMSLLTSHFFQGEIGDALAMANDRGWHLAVTIQDKVWAIMCNGETILRTDNRDSLDAFLYGVGLTCAELLPDSA